MMESSSDSECFEDCSESAEWTSLSMPHSQRGDSRDSAGSNCSGDVSQSSPSKASSCDKTPGSDKRDHGVDKRSLSAEDEQLIEDVIQETSQLKLEQDATRGAASCSASETTSSRSDPDAGSSRSTTEDERDEYHVDEEEVAALDRDQTPEQHEERRSRALELKQRANDEFKSGRPVSACQLYTDALRLCPLSASADRAVLFSNRAACRAELAPLSPTSVSAASLLEQDAVPPLLRAALADCRRAVELEPGYERARRRYARLLERAGGDRLDTALEQWRALLEKSRNDPEAAAAVARLPAMINDRNEKLKTEMMSKLKDLGNMVLKPFGMSTENFKLQPTESGGYNIQFVQPQK